MTTIKIAVMSDLHAYDTADQHKPSSLCIKDAEDDPLRHPIKGLMRLIETSDLTADVLLCPGDLGDRAHPGAAKYAWHAVNKIGELLGCGLIAGTAGNHDIDSRYAYNKFDAKGHLQTLDPKFPLPEDQDNDRYWSRHFAVLDRDKFRLLVLNSSAYHGGHNEEYSHGRVSELTLGALHRALANSVARRVNILLCHHHPLQHSELNLQEYDVMKGGQLLIDLLGSGDFGQWLIIHGHKHHPKIVNAAGSSSSPIVFSAGSLCASLYPDLHMSAGNQFYIIEIPCDEDEPSPLIGRFQAWDWAFSVGWVAARSSSGLPASGGFGWRGDINAVAQKIADATTERFVQWPDIQEHVPETLYLLPSDINQVKKRINENHGLAITLDEHGIPSQIGRPT